MVAEGEPLWLPEDTDAELEWIDYEASLCPGCGHAKAESMDPDNVGAYEAVPMTCFACAARDAESREASESRANNQLGRGAFDGLYFGVTERR